MGIRAAREPAMLVSEAIRLTHHMSRIMNYSMRRYHRCATACSTTRACKTQSAYIRAVRSLTRFLRRSPDTVSPEDLRLFQLHMVDAGTSAVSLDATLSSLKFFIDVTLERSDVTAKMRPVRIPRRLPVVLSREEVSRLIVAAPNI